MTNFKLAQKIREAYRSRRGAALPPPSALFGHLGPPPALQNVPAPLIRRQRKILARVSELRARRLGSDTPAALAVPAAPSRIRAMKQRLHPSLRPAIRVFRASLAHSVFFFFVPHVYSDGTSVIGYSYPSSPEDVVWTTCGADGLAFFMKGEGVRAMYRYVREEMVACRASTTGCAARSRVPSPAAKMRK
ncbi:hypothetical protein M501DRAFT_575812 [Patellaria atrata CBS 101060]|uniref:Uncharacterized protein n=1 Tax=Patellaria atrata CBS 101060 TaxID=1346257 RepID=A0A9P4VU36_9PEZI|nr:hypothetical protein M501DRAFT_575812 [Patellaria atrata CBS 101060]